MEIIIAIATSPYQLSSPLQPNKTAGSYLFRQCSESHDVIANKDIYSNTEIWMICNNNKNNNDELVKRNIKSYSKSDYSDSYWLSRWKWPSNTELRWILLVLFCSIYSFSQFSHGVSWKCLAGLPKKKDLVEETENDHNANAHSIQQNYTSTI